MMKKLRDREYKTAPLGFKFRQSGSGGHALIHYTNLLLK